MKAFKQYIQETLDKPYAYDHLESHEFDDGSSEHHYGFKDHNGEVTHVHITHSPYNSRKKDGKLKAEVDFTDGHGSHEATGKGTIRHISTVGKIMDDHAKKHPNLKMYTFTGDKSGGRNRLYTRLAKKAGGDTEILSGSSNKHYIPINRDKNGE